mgnify:CR=1 FL=1
MIEIFLILVSLIMVMGLCLHHYSMKTKADISSVEDCVSVRTAAEHSIMASNTMNPVLALVEVSKAVQIITTLHDRYGPEIASNTTKVDTREMLEVMTEQQKRIIKDILETNPSLMPHHPLSAHAGFPSA